MDWLILRACRALALERKQGLPVRPFSGFVLKLLAHGQQPLYGFNVQAFFDRSGQ
jgi:hypothetical protein